MGGTVALPTIDGNAAPATAAVLVDGEGRVVVVRNELAGGATDVGVYRFTNAGAPDTTFVPRGLPPFDGDLVTGAAALADGRLALWTWNGELLVLGSDGASQTTSEPRGTIDLGVLGTIAGGTVDAQQRLVVVGVESATAPATWFVRRYGL
jgi:hypothetical protein